MNKRITDNAMHPNGETVFKEYTQVERGRRTNAYFIIKKYPSDRDRT